MTKNSFIPNKNFFLPKTKRKINGFGNLIRDYDKDGVPNIIDCAPKNPKKHYVSERDPFYWAYREIFAGLRWGR